MPDQNTLTIPVDRLTVGDCILLDDGMIWPVTAIEPTGAERIAVEGRVSLRRVKPLGEFGPTVNRLLRDYESLQGNYRQ
jgi:hypothetical protein